MANVGPNYPSASEELPIEESSPSTWSNMANAYADDGSYASCLCNGYSNRAFYSGFDFDLPDGVTITGIKLETEITGAGEGSSGQDQMVYLRTGGVLRGNNKAIPFFPETPTYPFGETVPQTYGGATDLWGTTWSQSQVEDSTFGVDLQYSDFYAMGAILNLDFVRLTVYYAGNSAFDLSGIASTEAFGSLTVDHWKVLTLPGIPSAEAFGTTTLSKSITLSGIPSGEAIGTPSLSKTVYLTGIPSAEAVGTPTLSKSIVLTGIPSAEAVGTPHLLHDRTVTLTGIPSEEVLGSLAITNAKIIPLVGIPSAEAFGTPTLDQWKVVTLTGIPSAQAFGTLRLFKRLQLTGIASVEAVGPPTIEAVPTYRIPIRVPAQGEDLDGILLPITLTTHNEPTHFGFYDHDLSPLAYNLVSLDGTAIKAQVLLDLSGTETTEFWFQYS